VAAFALIHGGGGSAWDWHLVAPALRERGHDPVAVDLPSEDESAGWSDYTDAVVGAVGDRSDLVVVAHSLGGFTAPLVCARRPAKLLVLVAAMIPSPGERFSDWWSNSGYEETGYEDVFYHDVPPPLAAEARHRERNESFKALKEPWPLTAWPETPTRYLLCRDNRMFPPPGRAATPTNGSASRPTRSTAATTSPSAGRASWPSTSTLTPPCSDAHAMALHHDALLAPARGVEHMEPSGRRLSVADRRMVRRRMSLSRRSTRSRGGDPTGNPVVVTALTRSEPARRRIRPNPTAAVSWFGVSGQPCVVSSAKNARTSAAMTSGYSMATKWPPRGRTV
jgi:pimeloyl-ACP methyl ester carboxylesterase